MVSNTVREVTCFSDLDFPINTPHFPHNTAVGQYLEDFATQFAIRERITFNTRLVHLEKAGDDWALTLKTNDTIISDSAPRVVIATGRFNAPSIPHIRGDIDFSGSLGIAHSFNYKDPMAYCDKRVAVLGGSISALEIASDLAMLGAASVHLCQRRQRYVNPKMFLGTPIEHRLFTYRRGRLALDDPEALLRDSEAKILEHAGDPSRYGTPKPHSDFAKAGATGSQHYLNLVAEGRVNPYPWPDRIDGQCLHFLDAQPIEVDGIVAGTGFRLDLPFLSDDLKTTLKLTEAGIELDEFTFHPDIPGLALLGLWEQAGSYFTPLEQQARFLAYTWSGERPRPKADMIKGIGNCAEKGHHQKPHIQAEMALRFARLCGTDPGFGKGQQAISDLDPYIVTGALFRTVGPDRLGPNRE